MTDKELLELAAKAAGYVIDEDGDRRDKRTNSGAPLPWNPLTDDGDALRLAVRLRMSVTVFDDAVGVGCQKRESPTYEEFQVIDGDFNAATRRAIVRSCC